MPQLKSREYRQLFTTLGTTEKEKKLDSAYYVEGYATTWDRYLLFDDVNPKYRIYEQFSPNCFVDCDMSDIIMQYDHQGRVLARMSNNTLIVKLDEHGLFICADLSKSENSRNLYEEIANGLTTKMSWGFATGEYHFDEVTQTIVHTKVKKIYDVSSVSLPANDGTSINARSELLDEEINKIKVNIKNEQVRAMLKNKLALKLKLAQF